MKRIVTLLAAVGLSLIASADGKVWLDELDITKMSADWGTPLANRSVGGNTLKAGRTKFTRGVGTHANSQLTIRTDGNALSFEAEVGLDMEQINRGHGSVCFQVIADGKERARSSVMRPRQTPEKLKVDLTGVQEVSLLVTDAGDGNSYDHADWCNAFFTVKDGKSIRAVDAPKVVQLGILTPPASPMPRINGARRFGVRPGSPILFTLPVTGNSPLTLSATGLPAGAAFDRKTGRLSGKVMQRGTYPITFTAENQLGKATRVFELVVGDTLSLTPPMGWNSWNCFAASVSDRKIRQAAEAMVKSGLINHGWSYINIDDYWQNRPCEKEDKTLIGPERGKDGTILSNMRFPDMKALADYVHGLGLKIGLYSSPGPLTCGKCVGSWEHEFQDAKTYAEWGFDYLKYDWCSYGGIERSGTLKGYMKPYLLMSRALRAQSRDIIHSLCQYGMGNVSAWGMKSGGQCWRTTGDITDTWSSMVGILDKQDGLEIFVEPGAWNDPDMLIVGQVGWGNPHPTRLTPNEQYAHVSLWAILSAPLLIGCDMTKLDAFTLNLLTNDEVIEVNQDPAGHSAARIARSEQGDLWAKTLTDGSTVVAFFNRSPFPQKMSLPFKDLGMKGNYRIRDLWRQQELGQASGEYATEVLSHAAQLIRFFPKGDNKK